MPSFKRTANLWHSRIPPLRVCAGISLIAFLGLITLACTSLLTPGKLTAALCCILVLFGAAVWQWHRIAQLQTEIQRTEYLAGIGYITAGVTHELKNPLNFIVNFAELSLERIRELQAEAARSEADKSAFSELELNMRTVFNHAKRAEGIMNHVLLYAKDRTCLKKNPTDLNQLLEEAFLLAFHAERPQLKEIPIKVIKEFDPKAHAIPAIPADMIRCFINIVANALFALQRKHAECAAREEAFEPQLQLITQYTENGLCIRIKDNGTGISKKDQMHIFEPFYSTKKEQEGNGLGLAIAHDIVVQHAGTIAVDSTPGQYTEFRIFLPDNPQQDS